MSDDFEDAVKDQYIVEPLSIGTIIEGMRTLNETLLYITDFLADHNEELNKLLNFDMNDNDEIAGDMPAFDHECSTLLTILFSTSREFNETVVSNYG